VVSCFKRNAIFQSFNNWNNVLPSLEHTGLLYPSHGWQHSKGI
jgi:hypothetical protein